MTSGSRHLDLQLHLGNVKQQIKAMEDYMDLNPQPMDSAYCEELSELRNVEKDLEKKIIAYCTGKAT